MGAALRAVVAALAGAALTSGAAFADSSPAGWPGLVDVDGHQLYLDCQGSGSPTVVFDADLDQGAVSWELVQPAVAASTRACAYDRAGVGLSQPGPVPRTSQRAVEELRSLLADAGVPPPYILVGHGFGGLDSLLFAQLYPQEVAGLVLVDATHEEWYTQVRAALPVWVRDFYMRQLASNTEHMDLSTSALQVRNVAPRPSVPTVVLTHGFGHVVMPGGSVRETEQLWANLQHDLVARSPSATLIVAEQSGHAIARDQPDLVVNAIEQVRTQAELREAATAPSWRRLLPYALALLGVLVPTVFGVMAGWQRSRPRPVVVEPQLLLGLRDGLRARQVSRDLPR